MACPITNFNAASEILLAKPTIFNVKWPQTSSGIRAKKAQGNEEPQEQASHSIGISTQTTRRAAIGLGILAVSSPFSSQNALAADDWNGLWLTGPLPVPSVDNKIANEKTGTRSFLKKGIYMADIGPEGSAYRLRSYAFDLLALEDLMGQNAWNYFRQYLRQKSTVMYYDFDKVISAAQDSGKQSLTDLANKLFDNVEMNGYAVNFRELCITHYKNTKGQCLSATYGPHHAMNLSLSNIPTHQVGKRYTYGGPLFPGCLNLKKLEDAVKKRDEPQIKSCYEDTKALLQEVRTRMA